MSTLWLMMGVVGVCEGGLDFQREIRPILSDLCYPCHGPDEKERKGKLRLDTREGAFKVVDGKAIIKPGRSSESELYKRLISHDPEEVMPPSKFPRKPTDVQIAKLKTWIEQGAQMGAHWRLWHRRNQRCRVGVPGLGPPVSGIGSFWRGWRRRV